MNYKKILTLAFIAISIIGLGTMTSCNSDDETQQYLKPVNVAVTAFSLSPDIHNPGLDSVYFTIDLDHGVIFNADSLRKGIAVDKVVPKITFSNTVSEAVIIMSGGTTREGEVDFRANPTDSIDFTGDVKLRVKADNNEIGMTYTIKVNVHKIETDSLFWDQVSYSSLPTRLENPVAMKTIEVGGTVISAVKEQDGSYSRITYESLENLKYTTEELNLPFDANLQSLCATENNVWILDNEGNLWEGDSSLSNWRQTGENWESLIGSYTQSVVGIEKEGEELVFSQYPEININKKAIPDNFPVNGYSNFVTLANKWTQSPVAFFTGGIEKTGTLSNSTWAFDGAEWIQLGTGGIPALEGASIIPYYNYRKSANGNSMIEYAVWLLVGGREKDGKFNRDVYISYNNGVNWTLGTSSMQLPEIIPAMVYCDNVVIDINKSANLSDGWKTAQNIRRRINYRVDGDIITWECPYIYLFGGYSPSGTLYTDLWRGVLGRLTFVPVI